MYRQSCMNDCIKQGNALEFCQAWCSGGPYSYFMPTVYTTAYNPQPYYYPYGASMDSRWNCYIQCQRRGGSTASCCYFCDLC